AVPHAKALSTIAPAARRTAACRWGPMRQPPGGVFAPRPPALTTIALHDRRGISSEPRSRTANDGRDRRRLRRVPHRRVAEQQTSPAAQLRGPWRPPGDEPHAPVPRATSGEG